MSFYRETLCKHGLFEPHPWTTSKPLEAGDRGLSGDYFPGDCPGGSREEVTIDYEASDDLMAEDIYSSDFVSLGTHEKEDVRQVQRDIIDAALIAGEEEE